MSLNNYSPSLPATPQVNLPMGQVYECYTSIAQQPAVSPNDLEGRLRGMILSNGTQDESMPPPVANEGPGSESQTSRRTNPAWRRQQATQSNGDVPYRAPNNRQPPNPMSRAFDPNRGIPPSQGANVQYQFPHLRLLPPHTGHLGSNHHNQGSRNYPTQRQLPGHPPGLSPPDQAFTVRNQPYNRPPPTNRQLYNPGPYGMQSQQPDRPLGHPTRTSVDTQVRYLESLAHYQIPKAQISHEELLEKHALRQSLEQVCRKAVSEYEMPKARDAAFVPESVELRCFGSLSTTFATKSSDMDLVLLSPLSKPETSSPDSELPRLIEKALLKLGYGARLLTRTRIPIIRFCEMPTPELATLLLAERTKYEKERDAPPKTKVEKTPKSMEKGPGRVDKALTQDRSDDLTTDEAVKETVSENTAENDDKHDPEASESAKTLESHPLDSAQTKPQTSSQKNDEELLKRTIDKRERDDPSLAEKSDMERARLYKLAIQDGWYEPIERRVIKQFLSALERQGAPIHERSSGSKPQSQTIGDTKGKNNEQLDKARAALQDLPNVLGRYRPPPAAHPLDFPKEGVGIQCDINFSNHLALHNSHLLKCYASCDPRVRQMVLFVKAWSKKRKINTPYHGTLSSYGYVLMVLHYLVNIANPPVVPNLQASRMRLQDEMSAKEVSLGGYNVQFFRNEEKIIELAHRGQITLNREPLGSLLQGFFHHFAQQGYDSPLGGFAWTHDTLSLRTIGGIISKEAKGWTGAKTDTVDLSGPGSQTKEIRQRYLFAIEDPFETDHNIARTVVHNGIVAIRDEFRRAHRLIQNAGVFPGKGPEDLFAEADEKDNLQYRPFGPRPRKNMSSSQEGSKKDNGPVSGHQHGSATTVKAMDEGNAGSGSGSLSTT